VACMVCRRQCLRRRLDRGLARLDAIEVGPNPVIIFVIDKGLPVEKRRDRA